LSGVERFKDRQAMKDAVIVSAVRTAVGKAPKGTLSVVRPDEMAAVVIREALARTPGVSPADIDDVVMGCAMPEGEQGMNVARIASLRAGVPIGASAVTVNRFCSSGLQAVAYGAERIMLGAAEVAIGGGTESMSMVPMGGNKVSPNPGLVDSYPDVYLSTGLVAENHVRLSEITREEQDAFALRSHQRAIAAIEGGRFKDEVVPLTVTTVGSNGNGKRQHVFETDEGPRRDTSAEALAKLRPAFHVAGTVTAGNSSQMSDGAAAVLLTSADYAKSRGLTPLARFVAYATAGVAPELFGTGPVPAIKKALKMAGLTLDQIDLVELNEAFAAQVLACMKELPIDPEKLNVNGGAIALGHPLGCTGAKLTATLVHEMRRRKSRYGLVTMCVGGGMGAAGIFERL
jgi:acetyl-CoA acyltransferase